MSTRDTRGYGHFCALAKALERVGDRWTLLVVRDLLLGPKRFTDLMDRMAGVTPKTLTQRLRDLEADGLVEADRLPGRREVWYRLTPAGEDLAPALEELLLWGMRHLLAELPRPDEPVHPEHVLRGLRLQLEREHVDAGSVRWAVNVPGTGNYILIGDGTRWQLSTDPGHEEPPDVTITTTRSGLARFMAPPPRGRHPDDVEIAGKPTAVRRFLKAIEVFPFGSASAFLVQQ